MDDRERIIEDLRRWARQQRAEGVERVVLDRDLILVEGDSTSSRAAEADAEPRERAKRARAAAAGLGSDPRVKEQDLFGRTSARETGSPTAKADGSVLDELKTRHPHWEGSDLLSVAGEVEACRACGLGAQRNCSVPGMGNPRAKLVFIGEAPGAEEDRQGLPFVGRAGQLLDKILAAIDLKREDVHILNIIKCRPPENRNPAPDEIEACRRFLERQLEIIDPGLIVALGLFAGQWLTGKRMSLTKLRETGPFEYRGIPVYATYHTAALLRNPNWKKPAWEDFKIIRREYDKL